MLSTLADVQLTPLLSVRRIGKRVVGRGVGEVRHAGPDRELEVAAIVTTVRPTSEFLLCPT